MSDLVTALDQVILVDGEDREIGVMDKIEAHRGEALLHRAISVFVYDKSGKLLIQQRSQKKIVGALQWANTVCGNVRPGETYEDCAHRRLLQELGVTGLSLYPGLKISYSVACNEQFSEREMDQLFFMEIDSIDRLRLNPNPEEVIKIAWKTIEEIQQDRVEHPEIYAPWFCLFLDRGYHKKQGVV